MWRWFEYTPSKGKKEVTKNVKDYPPWVENIRLGYLDAWWVILFDAPDLVVIVPTLMNESQPEGFFIIGVQEG